MTPFGQRVDLDRVEDIAADLGHRVLAVGDDGGIAVVGIDPPTPLAPAVAGHLGLPRSAVRVVVAELPVLANGKPDHPTATALVGAVAASLVDEPPRPAHEHPVDAALPSVLGVHAIAVDDTFVGLYCGRRPAGGTPAGVRQGGACLDGPTVSPMDEVLLALAAQHAELDRLIGQLDEASWHRPSRCTGWDVADVVLHLAQTDELAVASAEGRFDEGFAAFVAGLAPTADVDEGAGLAVVRDRGASGVEVLARWRAASSALRSALEAADLDGRTTWVAGRLSVRTLATTRLSECWIHTEDVAAGLGIELEPSDRLWHVARLAWRTVPYAFARAGRPVPGSVAFDLTAPSGERWTFAPEGLPAATTVAGPAVELCRVAGQRLDVSASSLRAEGPDAEAVLALVRTFA